jgi:hypothetical protein
LPIRLSQAVGHNRGKWFVYEGLDVKPGLFGCGTKFVSRPAVKIYRDGDYPFLHCQGVLFSGLVDQKFEYFGGDVGSLFGLAGNTEEATITQMSFY